jgi:hypothetical protein
VRKTALNAAQPHNHIVSWFDIFGRGACVLVRQRSDKFIGEFLFNSLCHLVHKPNDDTRFSSRKQPVRVFVCISGKAVSPGWMWVSGVTWLYWQAMKTLR